MRAAPTPHPSPLTVLVDDVRGFKDERPALVARSSQEALHLLDELGEARIDDLWLDHDLAGDDTIRPVVELLVQRAGAKRSLNVGLIHIHTANVGAGHWMGVELRAVGYAVVRSYSLGMWTRGAEVDKVHGSGEGQAPMGAADVAKENGVYVMARGSDLDFLNDHRAQAGLPPVIEDDTRR